MKFLLLPSTVSIAGKPIYEAFKKSLINNNHFILETNDVEYHDNVDAVVIWSVLMTNIIRKKAWELYYNKKPIIVLEVGSLLRNKSWKISINGINRNAIWPKAELDTNRKNKFNIKLKPYHSGNYILFALQNPYSNEFKLNLTDYITNTILEIRQYTNKPIIIREHPRFSNIKINLDKKYNYIINKPKFIGNYDEFDLPLLLNSCHATVNFNSNPAIESIINGVPIFTDISSMAWDISNQNFSTINSPILHNRDRWFENLLHTEWFVEEIEQGIPLKGLLERLNGN